jgi:hypothetical protein
MDAKRQLDLTLNHKQPDKVVVDFGATAVTGIHVLTVERLREYYGLEKKPVRVIEPYQMLGLVEDDLTEALGIDVIGVWGQDNMFGYNNLPPLKLFRTFWGQEVLVPEKFSTQTDVKGDLLSFPAGDQSVKPSAKMPLNGYFFDAIERQGPIDDDNMDIKDNIEEFTPISDETLQYWEKETAIARSSGQGTGRKYCGDDGCRKRI